MYYHYRIYLHAVQRATLCFVLNNCMSVSIFPCQVLRIRKSICREVDRFKAGISGQLAAAPGSLLLVQMELTSPS